MTDTSLWQRIILSNDTVQLSLLPGIGGRVMNVRVQGKELLFENPDSTGFQPDLSDLGLVPTRASHLPFPLWGGEKTWVAPESAWPVAGPHPVLDSGPYACQTLSRGKVRMTSNICPISGLRIVRTVSLDTDGTGWSVGHEMVNCSKSGLYCGIWSVMMVQRPVRISCHVSRQDGYKVMMGDPVAAVSAVDGVLAVDCAAPNEFKIGAHPVGCVAEISFSGRTALALTAEASSLSVRQDYAHGHAFEVYNSADYDYAELEWHAPARKLLPGETATFLVRYRIQETAQ